MEVSSITSLSVVELDMVISVEPDRVPSNSVVDFDMVASGSVIELDTVP